MSMLSIKDLQVYYGAINAIKGISFDVEQGEIIALIGANGAGKTTILHTITGLVQAKHGSVMFGGKDLTKTPAHKIVSMGMAHVPEGRRVFAQLSVLENLMLGAYTRKDKAEIQESLKHVFKRFPRLEERRGQMAGTLSGGDALYGQSADVQAVDNPDGRAVDGTFSAVRQRNFRYYPGDKQERHDRASR